MQMRQRGERSPGEDVAVGEPSPGADVAAGQRHTNRRRCEQADADHGADGTRGHNLRRHTWHTTYDIVTYGVGGKRPRNC